MALGSLRVGTNRREITPRPPIIPGFPRQSYLLTEADIPTLSRVFVVSNAPHHTTSLQDIPFIDRLIQVFVRRKTMTITAPTEQDTSPIQNIRDCPHPHPTTSTQIKSEMRYGRNGVNRHFRSMPDMLFGPPSLLHNRRSSSHLNLWLVRLLVHLVPHDGTV